MQISIKQLERDASDEPAYVRFSVGSVEYAWQKSGAGGVLFVKVPGKPLPLNITATTWGEAQRKALAHTSTLQKGNIPKEGVYRQPERLMKGPRVVSYQLTDTMILEVTE